MKSKKAQNRILQLLKTEGAKTAVELGKTLDITSMGARQHLERMEKEGLISSEEVSKGVGRPKKLWQLTEEAQSHFPDRHDQLTVDMLISIKDVFGDQGLDQLIEHRSKETSRQYHETLDRHMDLEDKVKALVKVRSKEGYMADYEISENGFIFFENHCPICSAASACQGFCRSELEIFEELFAGMAKVERLEHILQGARRCAYSIISIS
ncbi:helix-turn-helix transcriptional regulator [Endozoicomonas numazuensis]|uniref:Transcriptional regulator n=1 Tax=Endozoicomonas numazuensis TaxID=1137799 RepID=A0A081NIV9_9GAMM|nr:metalloregulator ArsR/SmtB family transcription factor [Endozoicomonas numazuensis]KEQ18382.1 transcriptional regulator [Endozoicomonas numazuensis]